MNVNGKRDAKQRRADKELVAYDASVANWLASDPFHLTYNCDTRGRVYPIPHFNYGSRPRPEVLTFPFVLPPQIAKEDVPLGTRVFHLA